MEAFAAWVFDNYDCLPERKFFELVSTMPPETIGTVCKVFGVMDFPVNCRGDGDRFLEGGGAPSHRRARSCSDGEEEDVPVGWAAAREVDCDETDAIDTVPKIGEWNTRDFTPDDIGKVVMLDMRGHENPPDDIGYCILMSLDDGDAVVRWFYTKEQLALTCMKLSLKERETCCEIGDGGGLGIILTDHWQHLCMEGLPWADVTDNVVWRVPCDVTCIEGVLCVVANIEAGILIDVCESTERLLAEYYIDRLCMFGQKGYSTCLKARLAEAEVTDIVPPFRGTCDMCKLSRVLSVRFKAGRQEYNAGCVCAFKIHAARQLALFLRDGCVAFYDRGMKMAIEALTRRG